MKMFVKTVLSFVLLLFLIVSDHDLNARPTKDTDTVSGFFKVAGQSSEIKHVYAFVQKCDEDDMQPVGPDIILLFSDEEVVEKSLTDDFMDEKVAFNTADLIQLAETGKIHAFLTSIGHRAKGESDKVPEIHVHERAMLFHSVYGKGANVNAGGDGLFEGTMNGNQLSGKLSAKGDMAGHIQPYEYEVKFSVVAKDLPK
jgi:hypothetical protein